MSTIVNSCTANPSMIKPDGTSSSTITAEIINELNNPAVNVDVTWEITVGTGNLDALNSKTDTNGKATTTITSTTQGNVGITARTTDDSIGKSANVIVESASNKVISCTTDIPNIPSDGSLKPTITAVVVDDANKPQSNVEVFWSIVSGDGKVETDSSTTNESGEATVQFSTAVKGVSIVKATTDIDTEGKTVAIVADTPLKAPVVLNASISDDYTLDSFDVEFGVTAEVPAFLGSELGQIVTFHWGEQQIQFAIETNNDLPRFINVSSELPPEALYEGIHKVYYEASDEAGNAIISSGLEIKIVGGDATPETLPAPVVEEGEDGFINIVDAADGVKVNISYGALEQGDIITVYWNAFDKEGAPINSANYSTQIVFDSVPVTIFADIPSEKFFPNGHGYEGTVNTFYTLMNAQSGNVAQKSFTTTYRVDTLAP